MSRGGASLAGRRIVVTRRRDQATTLVDLLQARGATVSVVPATEIGPPPEPGPLDAALRDLQRFDWLVFTSANAVEAVKDRLARLGLPGPIRSRGPRIASVGPATTRVLERSFPEDRVGLEPESDYRAAGLVRAFEVSGCAGTAILVPASTRAREELPSGLRALGAEVTVVAAYATLEPAGLGEAVARCLAQGFDAVTFAAPSAVEAFAAGAGARVRGLPAVVIGPTTEVAARARGFEVLATASPSTAEGLVGALERVLGPAPGGR
jgi:uroporphyrinogen III methyltransferase/synthase